jgi:hypothetical protein
MADDDVPFGGDAAGVLVQGAPDSSAAQQIVDTQTQALMTAGLSGDGARDALQGYEAKSANDRLRLQTMEQTRNQVDQEARSEIINRAKTSESMWERIKRLLSGD